MRSPCAARPSRRRESGEESARWKAKLGWALARSRKYPLIEDLLLGARPVPEADLPGRAPRSRRGARGGRAAAPSPPPPMKTISRFVGLMWEFPERPDRGHDVAGPEAEDIRRADAGRGSPGREGRGDPDVEPEQALLLEVARDRVVVAAPELGVPGDEVEDASWASPDRGVGLRDVEGP